ncbi:MAG: hypothetical protein J6K92_00255, partial [Oscillospiraceae bacterium]|nr:hypothetical protein [Oscillospiraceae bacterium]
MRKFIKAASLLLTVIMLMTATVSCADGSEGEEDTTYYSAPENPLGAELESTNLKYGDFTYSVYKDGNISLNNYSGKEENIVLPSEIDGKPVVSIGEACFYFVTTVKTVEIPESIKYIERYAFRGAS